MIFELHVKFSFIITIPDFCETEWCVADSSKTLKDVLAEFQGEGQLSKYNPEEVMYLSVLF
jgi:hypothetical protein